jgi:hypothetical protein
MPGLSALRSSVRTIRERHCRLVRAGAPDAGSRRDRQRALVYGGQIGSRGIGQEDTMTMRIPAVMIHAMAMVLGACAATVDDDELVSTTEQAAGVGCPELGCMLNAASLGDGLFFHELHPLGYPNTVGVQLERFESGTGAPLQLQVVGHELFGIDPGGSARHGSDLVNARFILSKDGATYVVRIAAIDRTSFWVGDTGQVPIYTFVYTRPSEPNRERAVCTTRDTEHGVPTTVALVFTGDRYDAVRKTVTDGAAGWFNVACAGSAMAKMHLLRHTAAGQAPGYTTTVYQRQAMLKMLTDDVCGTGRSFTVDGEDVKYTDRRGWHPLPSVTGTTESIWTDRGAICLDEPRRQLEDGPGVAAAIAAECGRVLPSCAAIEATWQLFGYGYTKNPKLKPPLPVPTLP